MLRRDLLSGLALAAAILTLLALIALGWLEERLWPPSTEDGDFGGAHRGHR